MAKSYAAIHESMFFATNGLRVAHLHASGELQ